MSIHDKVTFSIKKICEPFFLQVWTPISSNQLVTKLLKQKSLAKYKFKPFVKLIIHIWCPYMKIQKMSQNLVLKMLRVFLIKMELHNIFLEHVKAVKGNIHGFYAYNCRYFPNVHTWSMPSHSPPSPLSSREQIQNTEIQNIKSFKTLDLTFTFSLC